MQTFNNMKCYADFNKVMYMQISKNVKIYADF